MPVEATSLFHTAADGLRLHLRAHRPAGGDGGRLPLVCLAGLTRSAADFEVLAQALAGRSEAPRTVYTFDSRGRGLSDHDPDWRNYTLAVEGRDVLGWLRDHVRSPAHWLGTSRGGLLIMSLAAAERERMRSVVLNDIGPVLESDGLRRIKGYVGVAGPAPRTIAEAIAMMRLGPAAGFGGLSTVEWRIFATTTFGSDPHDLRLRYDPAIARTLEALDLSKPLPDVWAPFDAMRGLPLLAIRGENSDLLSPATLEAMAGRWPGCETLMVPGQGHAPLLADAPTIARIDAFLARADA